MHPSDQVYQYGESLDSEGLPEWSAPIKVRFLDRWEEDELTEDPELEAWPRDAKPEDP